MKTFEIFNRLDRLLFFKKLKEVNNVELEAQSGWIDLKTGERGMLQSVYRNTQTNDELIVHHQDRLSETKLIKQKSDD